MTDSASTSQPSFLDELDARQDEVLRQLDELNARLEKLLNEHTGQTAAAQMAAAGSPDGFLPNETLLGSTDKAA